MKIIIAGSRTFDNYELLKQACDELITGTEIEIVSGACSTGTLTFTRKDGTKVYGADGLGERYAEENGFPVTPFPAEWKKYGTRASYIRNKAMSDGKSKGTKMMIDLAKAKKLKVDVIFS